MVWVDISHSSVFPLAREQRASPIFPPVFVSLRENVNLTQYSLDYTLIRMNIYRNDYLGPSGKTSQTVDEPKFLQILGSGLWLLMEFI